MPEITKSEDQALWLAEHTILPIRWTRWLVLRSTDRFGRLKTGYYENLILVASTSHLHWESAVIAQHAWDLLVFVKRQEHR